MYGRGIIGFIACWQTCSFDLLTYPIVVVSKQGFAFAAVATDASGSFATSHAAKAGWPTKAVTRG